MSIPIDKLYHFIKNIAKRVNNNDILIYRFYPYGSKNLKDLTPLQLTLKLSDWKGQITSPEIICHDQEPLNYDHYEMQTPIWHHWDIIKKAAANNLKINNYKHSNLRYSPYNIYDKCLLIHSEKRSHEISKYEQNQFIPVYYWCHAIISLDWYRFAQYESTKKSVDKTFLIYNRAWSNTREYRLKFIDLLIENNLTALCKTTVNPIEPQLNLHYTDYKFKNINWRPNNCLENYFPLNQTSSHYSADYEFDDYNATDIEIVLETLFDDPRLHLTEKVFRPIACGQPFILAATHGSLEYIRQYGFKTFSEIIDESYDLIIDPVQRLEAIIQEMKRISSWSEEERNSKMKKLNKIAEYNRKHFYSNKFFRYVVDELEFNLTQGLNQLQNERTGKTFLNFRKFLSKCPETKGMLINPSEYRSIDDIIDILKDVRGYK